MTTCFCTPYNFKNLKPVLVQELPSLTDQDKRDECDINFVIKQYVGRGKPLPCTNAVYADVTNPNLAKDYIEALQLVAEHSTNFELLSSAARDKFKTVDKYLEFISNPANLKESYELGYIDRSTVSEEFIYPERYTGGTVVNQNSTTELVSPSQTTSSTTSPQQIDVTPVTNLG